MNRRNANWNHETKMVFSWLWFPMGKRYSADILVPLPISWIVAWKHWMFNLNKLKCKSMIPQRHVVFKHCTVLCRVTKLLQHALNCSLIYLNNNLTHCLNIRCIRSDTKKLSIKQSVNHVDRSLDYRIDGNMIYCETIDTALNCDARTRQAFRPDARFQTAF